jgi:hypothetical protein
MQQEYVRSGPPIEEANSIDNAIINIIIPSGNYQLSSTVQLKSSSTVTIKGVGNVVISGNNTISQFLFCV